MNILAQIPTADQLESLVNADELTVWDFVWAALVVVAAFLLARRKSRTESLLRRILPFTPNRRTPSRQRASNATFGFVNTQNLWIDEHPIGGIKKRLKVA